MNFKNGKVSSVGTLQMSCVSRCACVCNVREVRAAVQKQALFMQVMQ